MDINIGISDLLLEDSGILSVPNKLKWDALQEKKNKYWAHELTTLRLNSRALWLKEGDANTKFFHLFASAKRNSNTIWSLNGQDGISVTEDLDLKALGVKHFSNLFCDDKSSDISEQLKVVRLFPHMTTDDDINCFLQPISGPEVEAVLKGFKKDKSPGPDGWPVEFFLAFFDLVGEELVNAVEQAILYGRVTGAWNSTFLTLIPKCEKPLTFDDFRPISLCNLVYKIIFKIAAIRLKPILNRSLSAIQFGFLNDR